MDIHAPESPIRSIKEFLIHIGVVTIGILIAIGLEQVVEAIHRTNLATEAVEGFQRELADNRGNVEDVLKAMPALRDEIEAEIAKLNAPADPNAAQPAKIHYPGIHLDLISNASWDAAVATQALASLPYDEVHRYAEAFGVYRLFLDEERVGLASWQELHVFGDDRNKLNQDERRTLIERLRHYEAYTYALDLVGKGALDSGDRALKP